MVDYPEQGIPDEEKSGVSWGTMLLGAAAVTGVAVAGIGLGGDKMAEWIGPETAVGKWLISAKEAITGTASTVGDKAKGAVEGVKGWVSGGTEAASTSSGLNTPSPGTGGPTR